MAVISRRQFLRAGAGVGLAPLLGCGGPWAELLPPARESADVGAGNLRLLARIAHVTDTHIVDEESPARFTGAHGITHSAWRTYESYAPHLLDGIVRVVNRAHAAGRTIDFLVHTGDLVDNAQANELTWALRLLDGGVIDPRSGPDDRLPERRPPVERDPHAPFVAQGLYQHDVHGGAPSIPWYAAIGNHDVYSIGVFPIVPGTDGRRVAPLPLPGRPGVVLPTMLDPTGSQAYGNVTPAEPGPPPLLNTPRFVEPNAARAFFDRAEYHVALLASETQPTGHGWVPAATRAYYSVSPVAGLRLIVLDTTDADVVLPGGFYAEGAIAREQFAWLGRELQTADEGCEVVIVATHHPSGSLKRISGSLVFEDEFRALLNSHASVALHICGHRHRNHVADRGGYLEIETCSTLDWPQETRLIELWQDGRTGELQIGYEMLSHLDEALPPLGDDPLRALREEALQRAGTAAGR